MPVEIENKARAEFREREYLIGLPPHEVSHFREIQTLVNCPQCRKHKLVTHGNNGNRTDTKLFWCEFCGYEKRENVKKLFDAGLDYGMDRDAKTARLLGTGWVLYGKKDVKYGNVI